MILADLLKFLHILAVVFMAIPLFNLIVVNERVLFGSAPLAVDQYFENIIRGGAKRCFVFQLTALVTGLWLVGWSDLWVEFLANWVLAVKFLALLLLGGLLSVVHFSLQPRIDGLLAKVETETIPEGIAVQIAPLRLKRKRLAAVCLFIVIALVLFGLQVSGPFSGILTVVLLLAAALFSWHVYRSRIPYGWF